MPFFLFVKQACKISHKSWNCLKIFEYSFLCFPNTLCPVQITMDLYPPEIINFRGLGTDWVNLQVPTTSPDFYSRQTLNVDCILITWYCPPGYHNFPDKDGCLNQHQPMISFSILPAVFYRPRSFPQRISSQGIMWWLRECSWNSAQSLTHSAHFVNGIWVVIVVNLWNGPFKYLV